MEITNFSRVGNNYIFEVDNNGKRISFAVSTFSSEKGELTQDEIFGRFVEVFNEAAEKI